jgi:hypothetical protein
MEAAGGIAKTYGTRPAMANRKIGKIHTLAR